MGEHTSLETFNFQLIVIHNGRGERLRVNRIMQVGINY